ncbi:MAG: LLM class flavin-dependent oxidoreductase [Gammaproteobacteria bacterium]|nr:LLM class flavin-dependent oxidoreductase [Gammaproteobacteria bacterium]
MSKILFGTGLRAADGVAEFAKKVEDLGFDVIGCGEHVMFHGPTANGFISLSVAAGATTSLRLMSTITLLPLYPAALVAKLGAALDVASGGRFMMGIGVGGEYPREFRAMGVPVTQRGARTDEALEVVHRTWTETDVDFDGRFTQLDGFTLKPMPIQKPRPPIWVAGRQDVAMRRTARYGDGWLPYMYTPEQLHDSLRKIRGYAEDMGRDPSEITAGVFCFTTVHDDSKVAVQMAGERLGKQYAQDFSKLVSKYAIAGNPDECCARLQEYIDAGATLAMLASACPDDYLDTNVERIAKDVVAKFR